MGFIDKIKAKATELGLDEKAQLAKEKAVAAADGNRDKIAGAVSKAGDAVNEKTGGKYADKVAKAQGAAMSGVDKVAASGTNSSATTTGGLRDDAVGTDAAIDRSIGQDGLGTAGETSGGESPVERAIGADAPTTSFDTSATSSAQPVDAATGVGTHDVREPSIDNAPVTDPEINSVRGENRGATDTFGNDDVDAQGAGESLGRSFDEQRATSVNDSFGGQENAFGREGTRDADALADPETTSLQGDSVEGDAPVRRVGEDLPEDGGPHGDALR